MDEDKQPRSLGHISQFIDHNIILQGAYFLSQKGFTQLPNELLTDASLSHGAKIAYAMLLRYAWQHQFCFPGQKTLATDMGTEERQVRNYLTSLKEHGYLSVKQRGQGRTNIYTLHLRVQKPTGGDNPV